MPIITWANPVGVTYGTALSVTQLNATSDVAGTFTYTPALGTILSASTQSLQVDFTPTDATNYATASKTVSLDVVKATPVITWVNPTGITYGTALSGTQLNATSDVAGTFTYTPALGTILSAGTQSLQVDFTPTDATNYATVSKTVSLDIVQAMPIITWNNPVDINNKTALSDIQLNATANVAGTFTYTPSIGTILSAGDAQSLKVDFEPADMVNYETASKTVLINVSVATGLNEENVEKFVLYPNPSACEISIVGFAGKAEIIITNLSGKEMLRASVVEKSIISIEALPTGTYLAKIVSEGKADVIKFIKK